MYQNYIFDLYGTLVDIQTDEYQPSLWQKMRELYSIYGARYDVDELKDSYHFLCEKKLKESNEKYPEIDLIEIFIELYKQRKISNEFHISNLMAWAEEIAYHFREESRSHIALYNHTLPILNELKHREKKIYLLSNAQTVFTIPEMKTLGILEYFDDIYISSVYGIKKPEKRFMQKLIDDHRLDINESIMIGNEFKTDIKIAQSFNMHSIFINSDNHSKSQIKKQLNECTHKELITVVNMNDVESEILHL